jgi:hypothetical protein
MVTGMYVLGLCTCHGVVKCCSIIVLCSLPCRNTGDMHLCKGHRRSAIQHTGLRWVTAALDMIAFCSTLVC